jgi:hypothetical protein
MERPKTDMKRVTTLLLVAMFALPPAGLAQSTQQGDAVDAAKLGVSLDRIRRELRQAEARDQSDNHGLKLEFTVQVIGRAPRINLLEGFPLTGPVPGSAPSHREVVDFLTPQAFRSPVVPISNMASWAAQKLWQRSKKQRCEDELATYRALVMQGVLVAAPRCSQ